MSSDAYTAVGDVPDLHIERGDSVFYVNGCKRGEAVPVLYVPVRIDPARLVMRTLSGWLHPVSEADLRGRKTSAPPPSDLPAEPQPIGHVRRTRRHLSLVEATPRRRTTRRARKSIAPGPYSKGKTKVQN